MSLILKSSSLLYQHSQGQKQRGGRLCQPCYELILVFSAAKERKANMSNLLLDTKGDGMTEIMNEGEIPPLWLEYQTIFSLSGVFPHSGINRTAVK